MNNLLGEGQPSQERKRRKLENGEHLSEKNILFCNRRPSSKNVHHQPSNL